jgi:hypothetical protein
MKIGVPKEIKTNENRVALVPAGAESLVAAGHSVMIEKGAGEGSGFSDEMYTAVGATIGADADTVWREADMIMKVKEPIAIEWPRMKKGQVIFTYFHFAADEKLTKAHLDSGAICIAYETVELPSRELPLLTPMSEVAGRMAVQEGAKYLEKLYGGRGVLLGGVPGVAPAKVVIIGGGVVGVNAAKMAAGLGAKVTVLDVSLERLRYLSDVMPANVTLIYSDADRLRDRGRRDRPGRLRRDDPRDHAREPDVRRRRRDSLRRRQHAGRSSAHVHARAHQRYVPVRDAAREQGMEAGAARQCRVAKGTQHRRGQGHVSGSGRSLRDAALRSRYVPELNPGTIFAPRR